MRRVTVLMVAVLILLSWATVHEVPRGVAAGPGCTDTLNTPVLQDAGWRTFSGGASNFATQFVESSVINRGQTFTTYVREETNATNSWIYRGISTDGMKWSMSTSPVLTTGLKGTWDYAAVSSPDVVYNGTGYMMYYVGDSGNASAFRQIGVAFSSDGLHWTKYANNPVIAHGPGTYDASYTRGPSVIFDNGLYKMWYFGTTDLVSTIEYATSSDGVHWTKYSGNPVFKGFVLSGGQTVASWPSVVKVNGTYLMAFGSNVADLGFATSSDGINWNFNNSTNVLLTLSGWHRGEVSSPSLIVEGSHMLLWYRGTDKGNHSLPYVAGVGFATCGLFVAYPATTETLSVTSVFVVTKPIVSTSIATSILPTTTTATIVQSSGAPLFEVAVAGVIGFAAAIAVAVALVARRVRLRRS